MTDTPEIPFGHKRVTGPSRKGDGIWNGKRFVKVKPVWPEALSQFESDISFPSQSGMPGG